MKRLVLALGSLMALVIGAAVVPHPVSASGLNAVATGGGFSTCSTNRGGVNEPGSVCPADSTGQHFAFSANEDLTTLTASGHAVFWFVNGDATSGKKLLQVGGQVTCVAVAGNIANITFQVSQESGTEQPSTTLVGQYLTFGAQDNGPPSQNNPAFDLISTLHPAVGPTDCTGFLPDQLVTYGNITVQTQTPLLAIAMTDASTYNITNAGDVYYNAGDGWLAAP